jgi:cell division protein FtsB
VNHISLKAKLVLAVLVVMLLFLQYALWAGKQNVIDLYRLNRQVDDVRNENHQFQERNDQLHEDVIDIKSRLGAIESQARYDLGLIKPGETYYQIVRSESD